MKIRKGFISNSSSSSFILSKTIDDISGSCLPTEEQIKKVKKIKCFDFIIGETNQFIIGYTEMDNLNIKKYFEELKIPSHLYQINTHIGWVQQYFIQEIIDKFKNG
jgi:predicted transcriptional regulator YdeE